MDPKLNFGLGGHTEINSILIIWSNDKMQKMLEVKTNQTITAELSNASLIYSYDSIIKTQKIFSDSDVFNFIHEENDFNDFNTQFLLPNYLSRQGPCMTKADINGDGREDLFIGGAKGKKAK